MSKKEVNTIADLDFEKYPDGLMPVIVQDFKTGQIMMQGFADREALDVTRQKGLATFWSRSQGKIWTKGESKSGNTLPIREIRTDCDGDTLIYLVDGANEACDVPGWRTCFRRQIDLATGAVAEKSTDLGPWSRVLPDEEKILAYQRDNGDPEKSGTARLWRKPIGQILKKLGEEAVEIAMACLDPEQGRQRLIEEVADFMYWAQFTLARFGVAWSAVEDEILRRRAERDLPLDKIL
jgi:phosphoribosyl-ATP pyrophosphohydrolase/phosphoribosyl-AMP cyclohydrolase